MFNPQDRKTNHTARVGMALFRMTQAVKKITQKDSDALGLSPVQVQALLYMYHTRSDVATIGNLAAAIGATHVTAVKLINGLIDKGLAVKQSSPDDRRVTLLQLTSEGAAAVEQLDEWGTALEEAVQNIPEELMDSFELGLGAVLEALQKQQVLIVAEPCMGCIHFRPDEGTGELQHYCAMIQKFLSREATLKECPEHTPSV
ncbi:MarR family winged helix-turn-helix transcriptional regulator [Paenibacillus sp. GCM10027628]|uniref:MarR family winged helix-turn-helix transcriptional regulator n=1 Tax=Paenibacillus sp. GCM10027628 TaxID=3273413 RepID=UPI0036318A97